MSTRPADAMPAPATTARRAFQLTRYFTATSLVAFVVLAVALYFLERGEQQFFAQVQREQNTFFAQVQAQLLAEQKEAARRNLLSVHETAHVALTNVFANALWGSHFAPLVGKVHAIDPEPCRRLPEGAAPAGPATQRQACFTGLGRRITTLPGFAAADEATRALMRRTTVFKVKVYDLRGLTVYSSEVSQVGEDKAENAGWQSAAAGRTASELVHRNRFGAFEGVVENRNLLQSYVPVVARGGGVSGVLELYSDVTPLLQQVDEEATRIFDATARNQTRLEQASIRDLRTVEANATRLLLIVAALLALTYGALLLLVRNGQRIIDQEARAREQAAVREQQRHRDKMATMAAMAANISHEVGNPLAIISGLAQDIAQWRQPGDFAPESPRMIVEQTARIADMTRRLTDFATAGRETPEPLDINQLVRSVCGFLAFDRRFGGTPIELQLADRLPACHGIPDHLTEMLMGLLQAMEEVCEQSPPNGRRIVVATRAVDHEVSLTLSPTPQGACRLVPDDPRLDSARQRLEGMGGRLRLAQDGLEIRLASIGEGATAGHAA